MGRFFGLALLAIVVSACSTLPPLATVEAALGQLEAANVPSQVRYECAAADYCQIEVKAAGWTVTTDGPPDTIGVVARVTSETGVFTIEGARCSAGCDSLPSRVQMQLVAAVKRRLHRELRLAEGGHDDPSAERNYARR